MISGMMPAPMWMHMDGISVCYVGENCSFPYVCCLVKWLKKCSKCVWSSYCAFCSYDKVSMGDHTASSTENILYLISRETEYLSILQLSHCRVSTCGDFQRQAFSWSHMDKMYWTHGKHVHRFIYNIHEGGLKILINKQFLQHNGFHLGACYIVSFCC